MTCANCHALREQLRIAQRELGLRRRDGAIGALMHRLGMEPMQAAILLDLYEANGRMVSRERTIANTGTASEDSLNVQILKMRFKMSKGAILTYQGVGYGLSPVGMSMVLAALEPPALRDSRGETVGDLV